MTMTFEEFFEDEISLVNERLGSMSEDELCQVRDLLDKSPNPGRLYRNAIRRLFWRNLVPDHPSYRGAVHRRF